MKKLLVALFLLLPLPALAQSTKAQLTTEINTNLASGQIGGITALQLRTTFLDTINSIMPTAPVGTGNLACFNGTTGLLQDCGVSPTTLTYAPPLGAAVTRTIVSKLSDIISVRDWGAVGDGVTDDAPAFRLAIDNMPYGGTLFIPWGKYLLNSCRANAILDFVSNVPNKGISIVGMGWQIKTGGLYTAPQGSLLMLGNAIPSTCDVIHIAGTDIVTGMQLRDFAILPSTGAYTASIGQHGVHIDGTVSANFYLEYFKMDHVFIDNMNAGFSIYAHGNLGGNVLIDSVINDSTLMNSSFDGVADDITLSNNTFGVNAFGTVAGPNRGIYVKQVAGATNFKIIGNNFVNFNGDILVDAGRNLIIQNNEFEQDVASTNALGSMVYLRGSTSTIQGAAISNNSFAQNSAVGNYLPINIGAATGVQITGSNTISIPAAYSHITMGASSSYTLVDGGTYYTSGSLSSNATVSDSGASNLVRSPINTTQALSSTPTTPAASRISIWMDGTDIRFHDINSSGVVGTTSVAKTCSAGSVFTAMNGAGVYTCDPVTSLNGVSYPASYTSGGIPFASATGTISSSALLAANQIVLGGGAGTAPATLGSLGTASTVLHGNASGAPTFAAVALATEVSGILPAANGGAGTINGALKANGSGVVSQAACANLSDATALCSTPPGSGVAGALNNGASTTGGFPIYTEGTFTPTITTSGTVGTPVYSIQVGSYERVGQQVTARFTVTLSSWGGSPTGNVSIAGLPVTSTSTTNDYGTCYFTSYNVAGLAALNYGLGGFIGTGGTTALLLSNGNAASGVVTAAQAGATASFTGACFYRA